MAGPKKFPTERYDGIRIEVPPGEFSFWTDQTQVSSAISNLAGYVDTADF